MSAKLTTEVAINLVGVGRDFFPAVTMVRVINEGRPVPVRQVVAALRHRDQESIEAELRQAERLGMVERTPAGWRAIAR